MCRGRRARQSARARCSQSRLPPGCFVDRFCLLLQPLQEAEELFETVSQALLSGQDRDCLAGWGAVVYVITKDKVIARTLKGRMD